MTLQAILALVLKATIVVVIAFAAVRIARKSRAAARHALLAAAFAVLLVLPIASSVAPSFDVPVPQAIPSAVAAPFADVFIETSASPSNDSAAIANEPASMWTPSVSALLIGAWLAGVALFAVPLIMGLRQIRAIRRTALPWRGGQPLAAMIAANAGIRRRVDVLIHESLSGPMTCGVIRPVVVLPADARAWTTEELSRALVHEFEHVRRCDWISHVCSRAIASLYWFHPMVWTASRKLSLEAERACDDAVLNASEAADYADQLVELAARLSATPTQPHLAMASRSDLAARVGAVLDNRQKRGRAGALFVGAVSAATAVLIVATAPLRIVAAADTRQASPSGPKPKYDAASIKPCQAEENPTGARGTAGGTNASISPGRFFVPCVTVEQLIYLAYAAYGARDDERLANDDLGTASNAIKVRGGPDWVHSLREKYQIEATAEGATERTVLMGSMLQSLLEDRFKLKLHRGTEEMAMLALGVGKSGVKLTPMKDGDCDPNSEIGFQPGQKPKCGNLMMNGSPTLTRWTFGGFDLSNLASQLSRTLGVHVIDRTGNKDKFIFTFEFTRGEDAFATEASVKTSLEQIGLTLEKTKAPRGFLVIDSIERPTPNTPAPAFHGAGR